MSTTQIVLMLTPIALIVGPVLTFMIYVYIRYAPIVSRIFEEKPLFLPLRMPPKEGGEEVLFRTADGLNLHGTYFQSTTGRRAGVVVFCHEYLSDRWSYQPYCDNLRGQGFDVFSFDFRSHGASDCEPNYKPLQWVTDHEVRDLNAALNYLRTRPDHDDLGFALFGVSRGGGTALVVAAEQTDVWGVVTDGAFPTAGTMLAYILRWAEIYVSNPYFWKCMPQAVFRYVGWAGRIRSERRLNCRYPDVEKAASRIAPRPWLMIHGQKDAYIVASIAENLYAHAGEPKQLWVVPKAKHNRCREVAPAEYEARVLAFLRGAAPRPLEVGPAIDSRLLDDDSADEDRRDSPNSSRIGEFVTS